MAEDKAKENGKPEFVKLQPEILKAWKRMRYDFRNYFVKHPFEIMLIERDLFNWLKKQEDLISEGEYKPKEMIVCDVPKGKGLIRPGSSLAISDYFYYTYLVGICYNQISDALQWSQLEVDFGYLLTGEKENHKWLRFWLEGAEAFRANSLKMLNEEGYTHVVITDITGFYENIHHRTLYSDLVQIGIDNKVASEIMKCLKKWDLVGGQGLPQSCAPSHILAKVYANPIDLELRNYGFSHLRYVDDIRIFCKSEVEARKAIVQLTRSLRNRGLNIQSSKTKIHTKEEAINIIDGVQKIIEEIATKIPNYKEFREQLRKYSLSTEVSGDMEVELVEKEQEEKEEIKLTPDEASMDIIKEIFVKEFLEDKSSKFDKTLFRFLLKRLGEVKDEIALEYCLSLFAKHPQETTTILNYFKALGKESEVEPNINEFLKSDLAIYPYQNYQIISWLIKVLDTVNEETLKTIRYIEDDRNNPHYLTVEARNFLGIFGNVADLNKLMTRYRNARNELEQVEIICCLEKLEKTKRNGFFGLIKDDNELNQKAIELIKNKK